MKRKKSVYRLLSLTLITALIIGCATGCSNNSKTTAEPTTQPTVQPTNSPAQTPVPTQTNPINISFSPGFGKAGAAYVPVQVTPSVADYTINPDLSNVVNLSQIPNLTAEQKLKLAANGFVVASSSQQQLFYIYEDNSYKYIPNFVTTDSVLQVYHVFYDYALRSVEGTTLLSNALKLNKNMITQLQKEYAAISDTAVKVQAKKALAYFGVAQLAFGEALPSDFPEEVKTLVDSEIKLLNAAGGRVPSPIFGYEIDYSSFTPRGHYTRSEELKKYFKGMSWYGAVPFPMYNTDKSARDTQSAMCSIIITTALCRLPNSDGGALWENIYSPTEFFVGASDDFTPYQFAVIISKIYGSDPNLNEISDPAKLNSFYKEVEALPQPQINAKIDLAIVDGKNVPSEPQFRFMGQRYIPDSEILQELCASDLPGDPNRPFPSGLDVFASLGSKRAAEIIDTLFKPTVLWPEYTQNFERMKAKFTSLSTSTWQSNLYYGWLWTQSSLTGEYGKGYPKFMQNKAWQDKSLATALGSWSEMRHDTILYAKGSAAEKGGDGPPKVLGYVEPNAELFNRLLWLTTYTRENLTARGILPKDIESLYKDFESLLTFLRDCAIKELKGEELTDKEYSTLLSYGGRLEKLTSKSTENGYNWYMISSEERNMAVIADVHSAYPGGYLEEGVGEANEIYAIVPIGGKLYITRGAVFDYYEFISQNRLTDEEWRAMLKKGGLELPGRPAFTSSFIAGEAQSVPAPKVQYDAKKQ